MNEMVSYQLARAASSGHALFAAPIDDRAARRADRARPGEGLCRARACCANSRFDPNARFHGEPGDLQELLGNLLENAFKWAHQRVLLTVRVGDTAPGRRAGLVARGRGRRPRHRGRTVAQLLQRGVRGDERVQGHGIGLAIVQDIVRGYRGELEVGVRRNSAARASK